MQGSCLRAGNMPFTASLYDKSHGCMLSSVFCFALVVSGFFGLWTCGGKQSLILRHRMLYNKIKVIVILESFSCTEYANSLYIMENQSQSWPGILSTFLMYSFHWGYILVLQFQISFSYIYILIWIMFYVCTHVCRLCLVLLGNFTVLD